MRNDGRTGAFEGELESGFHELGDQKDAADGDRGAEAALPEQPEQDAPADDGRKPARTQLGDRPNGFGAIRGGVFANFDTGRAIEPTAPVYDDFFGEHKEESQ